MRGWLWAIIAGCGPGATAVEDADPAPPCDPRAAVDVGTGLAAWEPLAAALPLQRGDQAGYHVWSAVRLALPDMELVLDSTVRLVDGPVIAAQRALRRTGPACPVEVAGLLNHIDFSLADPTADPYTGWWAVCGRAVEVRVEAYAPGGAVLGWGTARATLGPDPADAVDCPLPPGDTGEVAERSSDG